MRFHELYKTVKVSYHYLSYAIAGMVLSASIAMLLSMTHRISYWPLGMCPWGLFMIVAHLRRNSNQTLESYRMIGALGISCTLALLGLVVLL